MLPMLLALFRYYNFLLPGLVVWSHCWSEFCFQPIFSLKSTNKCAFPVNRSEILDLSHKTLGFYDSRIPGRYRLNVFQVFILIVICNHFCPPKQSVLDRDMSRERQLAPGLTVRLSHPGLDLGSANADCLKKILRVVYSSRRTLIFD